MTSDQVDLTATQALEKIARALVSLANSARRMAPLKGWEYDIFPFREEADLLDTLNRRAADGWELVFISYPHGKCTIRRAR